MIAAETDRARDALQSIPPDLPREGRWGWHLVPHGRRTRWLAHGWGPNPGHQEAPSKTQRSDSEAPSKDWRRRCLEPL